MLNSTMTFTFDYYNESLWIIFGDNNANKPISLAIASLVGTLSTLPFDNVKTRL